MTDKKTLTPAEALKALSEGKKLTYTGWYESYVLLDNKTGDIRFINGDNYRGSFLNFYEYTEPKPKVVWVEYLCVGEVFSHTTWFKEDPVDSDYHPTGRKIEV